MLDFLGHVLRELLLETLRLTAERCVQGARRTMLATIAALNRRRPQP